MKLTTATIVGAILISTSMVLASCSGQPDGEGDDHATQNENLDIDATENVEQDTMTTTTDTTTSL